MHDTHIIPRTSTHKLCAHTTEMNRLLSLALLTGHTLATALLLTDEVNSGAVTVETTSTTSTVLDGPKLGSTANDTTYDW